jgi:transposase-like protein
MIGFLQLKNNEERPMEAVAKQVAEYLRDETKAVEYVERLRWPNGPKCPFCGSGKHYRLNVKGVKVPRIKCGSCRKQYTVMVGTIFHGSHISLGSWIYAIHKMASSKKGVSAKQLERELGLSYQSAWFLCHRVRLAMTQGFETKMQGVVTADETYVGPKHVRGKPGRAAGKKVPVFTLVQSDGDARSFVVPNVSGATLKGLIRANVEGTAMIMTDSFPAYRGLNREFAAHETVDHSKEYVRGTISTNFAESYFSLLKRGVVGTFHHISKKHMPRYLAEFDRRWNTRKQTDQERMEGIIASAEGKRLQYRERINQSN